MHCHHEAAFAEVIPRMPRGDCFAKDRLAMTIHFEKEIGVELMEAIRVNQLTHDYGELRALAGISFSIAAGEVFSLLGPNGAGKTTTIRILTGQLKPSSGQACVFGFDVVRERQQIQSRIGVVFEYPNLYERMTARENLLFAASLYGVPHGPR